ncbi:hypothetical protein BOTBODRAFT_55106 [Botryobasidium botryosum FD-172 SS1]|uniref:Uncharacterized protein n=1 Tax=Botryobasidium botryosum (strain FD-172 SS1) TaxID=930990 RepID=A0A067MJN1_BOTB1|nr:hypothetical protein BOTBODRAFT_55106 [Botryobasidium botryosum FD-172 SS1]
MQPGSREGFHPAIQRIKEIIHSGELGQITNIAGTLALPRGLIDRPRGDIWLQFYLNGGCAIDMGVCPLLPSRR